MTESGTCAEETERAVQTQRRWSAGTCWPIWTSPQNTRVHRSVTVPVSCCAGEERPDLPARASWGTHTCIMHACMLHSTQMHGFRSNRNIGSLSFPRETATNWSLQKFLPHFCCEIYASHLQNTPRISRHWRSVSSYESCMFFLCINTCMNLTYGECMFSFFLFNKKKLAKCTVSPILFLLVCYWTFVSYVTFNLDSCKHLLWLKAPKSIAGLSDFGQLSDWDNDLNLYSCLFLFNFLYLLVNASFYYCIHSP